MHLDRTRYRADARAKKCGDCALRRPYTSPHEMALYTCDAVFRGLRACRRSVPENDSPCELFQSRLR